MYVCRSEGRRMGDITNCSFSNGEVRSLTGKKKNLSLDDNWS